MALVLSQRSAQTERKRTLLLTELGHGWDSKPLQVMHFQSRYQSSATLCKTSYCVCVLVGLDDGTGAESAERSASVKDDVDENMATPMDNVRAASSWPGWEPQPAPVTEACWGPADDGVQWENVHDAENVELGDGSSYAYIFAHGQCMPTLQASAS